MDFKVTDKEAAVINACFWLMDHPEIMEKYKPKKEEDDGKDKRKKDIQTERKVSKVG
ncbi:hypothetical protein [Marinitoga sp. 1135]|uniref:hypothetical protein n=1 Tax=Marinitoga sp. 1135 TaxID=1643333 RepID=UPI001586E0A6|nr:hypothetical protein [Marinitoga sp. 1135]